MLGCLLACWAKPAAASSDDPHVLVLGRISDDPKHHYEQLKPLLDYIVPRMADLGIRKGIQVLDGLDAMPTPREALARSAKWAPFRTQASFYLWRIADAGSAAKTPVKRSQD